MHTDRLNQRLMVTFLGELEDHVRSLERDLLALEKAPEAEARGALFATLFRAGHSLKGAARSVGLEALEAAGHRLEELFASGRDGRIPVDKVYFERALPIVDDIRASGRQLRAQADGANTATQANAGAPSVVPTLEEVPAASPAPGPATAEPPAPDTWSGTVRVAAEKLDSLLLQSGELLVARHRALARAEAARALNEAGSGWQKERRRMEQRLAELIKGGRGDGADARSESSVPPWRVARDFFRESGASMSRFSRDLQKLANDLSADHRSLDQTARWIDNDVRRVRMLPFAEACEGLTRMVRDLAVSGSKKAELVIEGGDIEIDRAVLDGLKDPLVHLIRNAVDHGIEPVAARRVAGKAETGRVTLTAAIRGGRIAIIVGDDGRGLDLEAIREQLRKRGITSPDDESTIVDHIFSAGLSTAPAVTALSGRGVGLDVVKSRVQSLRGTVEVAFEPGRGTRFLLRVPLTLTSVRAILVKVGGRIFAIDTASVDRVLCLGADDIQSAKGREVLVLADRPIDVVTLGQFVGIPERPATAKGERRPAVVLSEGARMAAFVVDDIQAERDVVIRPLGPRLRRVKHVSGATVLPDGTVALILNSSALVNGVRGLSASGAVARSMTVPETVQSRRLLLVDDSITTRTLERSILEAAGYDVRVAADGVEAWRALVERGADLVISDVEMPRMDGFSLTETIRRSTQFRDLPVILMTARDDEADKAQGLKVGANAYLLKSAFDQRELLATIGQIL